MVSEIQVTENERISRRLLPDRLFAAVELLRANGYLTVKDVLPPSALDEAHQVLRKKWLEFQNGKPAWRGGGKIIGHLGMVAPIVPEIINVEIIGDPIITAILSGVLGENVRITGIGGNVNLPGSKSQSFHSDLDTPDLNKVLVNIPLTNVDEYNGSIELIPNTHLSEGQPSCNPVRINTNVGSVLLRYPHLLHRGRENQSPQPRHMIGYWVKNLTAEQQVKESVCLDPYSSTLFKDSILQFKSMGNSGEQPVFTPNYFAPTFAGLIKEVIYCGAPELYGFLANRFGNRKSEQRATHMSKKVTERD